MSQSPPRRVLFEITQQGAYAKVSAIDEATGLEVSVVGPATAAQHDLRQLALRKLNARLEGGERSPSGAPRKPETTPSGGGGSRLA